MLTPPALHTWIKIKINKKDDNGKNVWMGHVYSVSPLGITLSNNMEATSGENEQVLVEWEVIESYEYFGKDEVLGYYTGSKSITMGDLMKKILFREN